MINFCFALSLSEVRYRGMVDMLVVGVVIGEAMMGVRGANVRGDDLRTGCCTPTPVREDSP